MVLLLILLFIFFYRITLLTQLLMTPRFTRRFSRFYVRRFASLSAHLPDQVFAPLSAQLFIRTFICPNIRPPHRWHRELALLAPAYRYARYGFCQGAVKHYERIGPCLCGLSWRRNSGNRKVIKSNRKGQRQRFKKNQDRQMSCRKAPTANCDHRHRTGCRWESASKYSEGNSFNFSGNAASRKMGWAQSLRICEHRELMATVSCWAMLGRLRACLICLRGTGAECRRSAI